MTLFFPLSEIFFPEFRKTSKNFPKILDEITELEIIMKMAVASPENVIMSPESIRANWPQGYKNIFMLNSAEHEISNACNYKTIKKFSYFQAQISLECYFSCSKMLKCQRWLAF